jgi:GT2 family glycosyltransferase
LGITYTKNDIIILNSDTVVTNHWLDKMKRAAYNDAAVGSVTALTNNGTIASVPYFNIDNVLPPNYTIQEFADLVEKVSNKSYPILPTAVGHAMFIKREVIERVGLLDELNFGKGYGEEEEYSSRIIKNGYKNVVADDTFIYHHGSTSFKSSKKELIKRNKMILKRKHKLHSIRVKKFICFNNDMKKVCNNIQKSL